jgi:hypothetical protein
MTETKAGAGAILIRPEPEVAARAIYDFLLANGIVVEGLQDRSQPPRSTLEVDTCLIP